MPNNHILFSMSRYGWLTTILLIITVQATWALDLDLPERSFQGDMIFGRVTPGAELWVNGLSHTVGSHGYFVLGIPRDLKRDLLVKARKNNISTSHTIRTLRYDWRIQHIKGLPDNYVNPGKGERKQIEADAAKVSTVRRAHPYALPLFLKKGFILPVTGRISGIFGSQRVLNGEPRNPHSGVDIAAPLGTPVHSPANGIVRLVAENTFLMGNVLMIDHGLGISSIFIHLDTVTVAEGDLIRQGETVARVGQTGRATGPHLHWGVSVESIAIDPLRLLGQKFPLP